MEATNTSTSQQASGQDNLSSRGVSVNRYERDMAQARAMRRKGAPATNGVVAKKDVPDAIALGLQGIEEAERHRDEGQLEKALRMYELSLEALIKHLPSCEPGFKGSLQAMARMALNSAEAIKEKLKGEHLASRPSQEQTTSQSSKETSFSSNYDRLSNALANVRSSPPKQAAMTPTRRSGIATGELRQHVLSDLYVPSSDLSKTTWSDVSGLANIKQALQETAILPLMRPDLFTGLRRPQNILLWGPPGTGKTMLVRAVANESGCNLFACSASSLTSKWMGESEKIVRALFQVAHELSPSIVFIDEIDSLMSSRKSDGEHESSRRLKTEFMVQMEGILSNDQGGQVLVIACTNCPWDIDSAVLRRFPRRLLVPLPDADARYGLLTSLLQRVGKYQLSSREMKSLAKRLAGFSCSDITAIASEASFGPIRSLGGMSSVRKARANDIRPVIYADFESAIGRATKSINASQLKKYDDWLKDQGSA